MEFMDKYTEESLDFLYILKRIDVLTPYGKIYRDRIRPYVSGQEEELKEELEKVEKILGYLKHRKFYHEIKNILIHVKDLRNSVERAAEGSVLTEIELFEIKIFVLLIKDLDDFLNKYEVETWDDIKIERMEELEYLLDPEKTGIPTFYIYDSYSEELLKIRKEKKGIEKEIKIKKSTLKDKIKKDIGLNFRPDGTITVQRDDEETVQKLQAHPYLSRVSETYLTIKFSVKSTEEIVFLDRKLFFIKEKEEEEEYKIIEMLTQKIASNKKKIFRNMASIGKLDFLLGKAHFAEKINGVKPVILHEHMILIEEGRHPKVEESLRERELKFTPVTISIKEGVSCITGANMGGKTVSLKLVGLLCAMAQYGLFVPAEKMEIGLNNFINASIGDMQSADRGLSTFGSEIQMVKEAVKQSNNKGLILIDELARGTNPEEGFAISKAVVNYLKDKNSITLITTHYDNIADMEDIGHLQVVGLSNIDFEKLKITLENYDGTDLINKYMDYRLIEVKNKKEVPRDALNIARLMGLDEDIIKEAEKILEL